MHRAAKWQVTSLEKADSLQSSFNYESGESSLIRQRMGKSEDSINNVYKSQGKVDSPDSPLAIKRVTLGRVSYRIARLVAVTSGHIHRTASCYVRVASP